MIGSMFKKANKISNQAILSYLTGIFTLTLNSVFTSTIIGSFPFRSDSSSKINGYTIRIYKIDML